MNHESMTVKSAWWDYEVLFAEAVGDAVQTLSGLDEAFMVIDENVLMRHSESLRPLCDRFPVYKVLANEETKSLLGVQALVDWLIEHRAVRSATIIAVGGGCIQDLVGFTAHIYYRGISWIFLPTTLLSQADSCIGAKTGINVLPFKNQLGVLHAPRKITIAAEFLETLPDLEIMSGYGEIVKLSVTSSHHFLDTLEEALSLGGLRNAQVLALIKASLIAKREIIEADEYENGLRRILNYGHSFGHALEACSGHAVPHGLAVLWGISVINWLGVRWGITDAQTAERLDRLMRDHFAYVLPIEPSSEELLEMLARDKKVVHGMMNFAVLDQPGSFTLEARPIDEALLRSVSDFLSSEYVFRAH